MILVAVWGVVVLPFAAAGGAALAGRVPLPTGAVARGAAVVLLGATGGILAVAMRATGLPVAAQAGPLALRVDPLACLLSGLILGLSAVIQWFAVRYLRGDPRQLWWVVWANLLTGFSVLMVCAATVGVFTAGWIAAGASLVALLTIYRGLPGAADGARRAGIRFALGDLGLLAATVIVIVATGHDVELTNLGAAVTRLPASVQLLIALLAVGAALSRSTQLPFHRWLPATLTTPTPVSALLHAGVVNAGAILVIRFSPAIGDEPAAMVVLFVAGAATLIYASAVRLVKPDVKGRLVFSTMAQMSYMIMACGLGAYAGVVLHLVAHSLFKSSLFLGAGGGIRSHARARDWPAPASRSGWVVAACWTLSTASAIGAFFAATRILGTLPGDPVTPLIAFVLVTAAVAGASWLTLAWSPTAVVIAVAAIGALGFGYTALLNLLSSAIPLPAAEHPVSAWWVAVPIIALGALQLASARPGRWAPLNRRLYARLLASSVPQPSARKELV
ncbi:MAG TPA: proton-conducting transporter membrane subunit [Pseudolysinimonas sp.]|nr:proton-conducting transporter membrane subunit [Pseudolysinimonas sp.]